MPNENIKKMQNAHEKLCEFKFDSAPLEKGYTDRTLRIDLEKNEIKTVPVTNEMKKMWVGGKGFDLWLTLQEIDENTKWDSQQNPICFSAGPLGGTTAFPGSGKTIVTSISPLTGSIIDSNVGGYFGPYLKFAGFDALSIVGKAEEDVLIFIDALNKKITIEKAPLESVNSHVVGEELAKMYADDEQDLRNISVVSSGTGAEYTRMGILNFSFWDWRRQVPRLKQAGRGGIGTVFRNKNIKALAIKSKPETPQWVIEESKVANSVTPKEVKNNNCEGEVGEIQAIIQKWDNNKEFVIEMMLDIQEKFRFISKKAIDQITKLTGVQKSHLYHIATFYKSFSLEKKGETIIQVCVGTTCHVKGAANIIEAFERELDIKSGEATADNRFSLEPVACLGVCSLAPVVKIGEEIFGEVKAKDVAKLLEDYSKKKEVRNNE